MNSMRSWGFSMSYRCAGLLALVMLGAAEDAAPAPASPAGASASVTRVSPDPTSAVVAEGVYLYRQRDLDALMLIAARHARQKLGQADEDQLRQALIQALTAREALVASLAGLPTAISGKARDALVLDLLDYQADRAPLKPLTPSAGPVGDANATTPASNDAGPVLVRLPNLTMTRTLAGIGKRQLVLGIALYFSDAAVGKMLENRAPLVQDAILGHLNALPDRDFAEPNQLTLKEGLIAAVKSKVPEFPADGILIPQVDVTIPDAPTAPTK